ncbi:MAG: hypothetical protein ACI8RD_014377 [Bacillariaceae sp.]|jgi:hypothetical protein
MCITRALEKYERRRLCVFLYPSKPHATKYFEDMHELMTNDPLINIAKIENKRT